MTQNDHPYLGVLRDQLERKRISRREFLKTATLLGTSAASAYAMVGLGVLPGHGPAHAQARRSGTLRLAMRLNDISNPHTYSANQTFFVRQTLEHLTITGADNITRPLLLERWEASPDLKTWTLHIRRNAKWQSGRPFVADDVIWNLKRALDPKTGSATVSVMSSYMLQRFETGEKDDKGQPKFSQRLWDANAIEKVDDHTVRLNAKAPNLFVPDHLFHHQLFMMAPEDEGVFKVGSNATGPFRIESFDQGRRCVMKARADYWGGAARIDILDLIDLGDNASAALAALAADQIDGVPSLDITSLGAAKALANVNVYEAKTANTGAVRVRVDQKPFDDPRVRKALRLSANCQEVLDLALDGLGTVGEHHMVARIHPDYAAVPPAQENVEEAKRLLAEAGYPRGIDSEIYLKSAPAWESQVVQSLVQQWQRAGIRVKINQVPSTRYWEIWKQVPMGFTDWIHRPHGIMLLGLCFRSGGAWNKSGYANPEYDKLLDEAESKLDLDERRKVMAKLQRTLLEDGPIVQPVFRSVFAAYNKRVKDFRMHPTNYNYYKDVEIAS